MKTAVALSGGLDSLASLILLKEQGHDLLPLHARFFHSSKQSLETQKHLKDICAGLGLPLTILDLTADFQRLVVKPFISAYLKGLTPNPCALCNRRIKFGLMLERAGAMGAQALATGHYALVSMDGPAPSLWRGRDKTKDQSYFLSMVPVNVFKNVLFPLHNTTKTESAMILRQKGIEPPVRDESNEICFIDNDYREFISQRVPAHILNRPGPVSGRQGEKLGRHKGLWRYTQGQRRGLGIPHAHPLYVLEKKLETNTLVVGTVQELKTTACRATNLNIQVDPSLWPDTLFVQTRYRQKAGEARVKVQNDLMLVSFSRPVDIPAPGQVAAAYSEQGQVLAAGIITDTD